MSIPQRGQNLKAKKFAQDTMIASALNKNSQNWSKCFSLCLNLYEEIKLLGDLKICMYLQSNFKV